MQRTAAHCFVESAEARAALTAALADRRLAKLAARTRSGGVATAAAAYAAEPSPALLVIETVEADAASTLAAVDALAEVCQPDTVLVLLGTVNDVELFRQLTRRGVADYIAAPFEPGGLAQALLEAASGAPSAQTGRAVAFFAAKGGAGASALAHNVAWLLSRAPDVDAAVVDLDFPFGSADIDFNLEPSGGLRNLLAELETVDAALLARFAARIDERLALFAAPAALDAASTLDAARLETVLEAIRTHYKFTALDLPHVWTAATQTALRWADQVVLATPTDLAGLRNTRNLLDWLADARPGAAPPLVALTGAGAVAAADFAQSLGVEPAAVIPWDGEAFRLAAAAGKTALEAAGKSPAVAETRKLADALALRLDPRRAAAPPPKPRSLQARLMALLGRRS